MYVLSNKKGQYICKNRFKDGHSVHETYSVTTNVDNAETWEDENKARNIAKSCLDKLLKSKGFEPVKKKTPSQTTGKEEEKIVVNERELQELLNDIVRAGKLMHDIESKREYLSQALSNVDKEITDIHHWIELGRFNAYQGYQAFAKLKVRLEKRRSIKNGMAILRAMSGVETAVYNAENRNYRPRILSDLFEE